jgi:hypothetical protein
LACRRFLLRQNRCRNGTEKGESKDDE